jgi:D-alanyl-D-alanine dipeptidase
VGHASCLPRISGRQDTCPTMLMTHFSCVRPIHLARYKVKPYQQIPIQDCGEPLLPIPLEQFAIEQPHAYEKLGAPYGDRSPYFLRQSVLERLLTAQDDLQTLKPGWRIQIFDAYRPVAVQQFMVDYTFAELVRSRHLTLETLTPGELDALWQEVYLFWAVPSPNPQTPPPHSTGAAIDVTLVDELGQPVDMGSAIDEISPRSYPEHFAPFADSTALAFDPLSATFHERRLLLNRVMTAADFQQHPNEWWHFSWGDQMWVWLCQKRKIDARGTACYGRI